MSQLRCIEPAGHPRKSAGLRWQPGTDRRRARTLTAAVDELAARLGVAEGTIARLAAALDLDLHWLAVLASPDVVNGTPATWDGMLACGLDPETGASLSSEAAT